MAEVTRISVEEARQRTGGGRALLVCGYEDDEKCRKIALDGGMSFTTFRSRVAALPKDQEIIFYCA